MNIELLCSYYIFVGVLFLRRKFHVGRELAQAKLVVHLFIYRAQKRYAIDKILPPILPFVGVAIMIDFADFIVVYTVII